MALSLGGCATTETAEFEADYEPLPDPSLVAQQQFAQCQVGAMQHHQQAVANASAALFYSAAEALSHCVSEASADEVTLASADVMQASALAVLAYIQAGDISSASQALGTFEYHHPNHDLYLANGASFLDSARLLLTGADAEATGLVNAGETLKSELRRQSYWQTH